MDKFILLAQPWWVNLLVFVPVGLYFYYRKNKLQITKKQLLLGALFAIAFGFVEAAVVIYLRAAVGFLPGYMGTLTDVMRQASSTYQQIQAANSIPQSLLTVEFFREIATLVILGSVAMLAVKKPKEQFAFFLWAFAFWDIFYYVGLRLTIGWPSSFTTTDVLFLIPVQWLSEVWFPILVSSLSIAAVALNSRDIV